MSDSPLLRPKCVFVKGLFGLYDHFIEFKSNERITILHGPNGVGKTVLLKMINSLLKNELSYLKKIPFSRFKITFLDDSFVELTKEISDEKDELYFELSVVYDRVESHSRFQFKLSEDQSEPSTGTVSATSYVFLRNTLSTISEKKNEFDFPEFKSLIKQTNTFLIEEQRLITIDTNVGSGVRTILTMESPTTSPTVLEYSKDFKDRLGNTMAQYGRQSQILDQSFPQRLISGTDTLTIDDLQTRLTNLSEKTKDFEEMGILDEFETDPFNVASLTEFDSTRARVMTLYVQDTETKLAALDDLANRVKLLLSCINEKFQNKKIRLDREFGFVAESNDGDNLSLDSLSSGEQHELVLLYNLLFKVPTNTIVLIDEPELSLHVAWQKKFLADLLRIVEIADIDAVIATHSPYIIGDRHELMVGLGN